MITLQEIFDRAVIGVITQGKPSVTKTACGASRCLYRGEAGTKCAVGHLIDDAVYTPDLEGNECVRTLVMQALEQSLGKLPEDSFNLIIQLQLTHDVASTGSDFLPAFIARAREIAADFNLTFPKLPNASN